MKLTDTDRVKYVAVEILANTSDNVKDIECGLFIGITLRTSKDNKITSFIVVALTNNIIKIFNLSDYGIVTIELVEDMTRFTTIFEMTKTDQLSAISTLDFITEGMHAEGRLLKNDLKHELIDIDTYSEYDNWVISTGGNLSGYGDSDTNKGRVNKNLLPETTVKKVEKKPELGFIEKKGSLTNKNSLSAIYELVKKINYFEFSLPICSVDIHNKNDKKVEIDIDTTDDPYSGDFYNTHGLY